VQDGISYDAYRYNGHAQQLKSAILLARLAGMSDASACKPVVE